MNWQAAVTNPRERIIVALDVASCETALALVRLLSPHAGLFKIGLQLYTATGPDIIRAVRDLGGRVFLDLKLHDIPNTARGAVESASSLGVEMLTIHLSGGREMLEAAKQARAPEMRLLGVTVLTSANEATLRETGINCSIEEQVLRLAKLCVGAGIAGVVASAQEARTLRQAFGNSLGIVTPGIRLPGSEAGDQKRVTTPAAALEAGADYLVIGRPIIAAPDPRAALDRIVAELSSDAI